MSSMIDRENKDVITVSDTNWPSRLDGHTYESLDYLGDPTILRRRTIAILSSSQCPGEAILKATKWIGDLADDESTTVVSGFHSAMEKSFLEILLGGRCGLVVCPARSLIRYRVPAAYKESIDAQRLAILSCLPESVRSNSATSSLQRNRLVADLATEIVVTYAAERSRTEQFALELLHQERKVHCLDTGCNTLLSGGAKLLPMES